MIVISVNEHHTIFQATSRRENGEIVIKYYVATPPDIVVGKEYEITTEEFITLGQLISISWMEDNEVTLKFQEVI